MEFDLFWHEPLPNMVTSSHVTQGFIFVLKFSIKFSANSPNFVVPIFIPYRIYKEKMVGPVVSAISMCNRVKMVAFIIKRANIVSSSIVNSSSPISGPYDFKNSSRLGSCSLEALSMLEGSRWSL